MTAAGPVSASGLFTGTAAYYEQFRAAYPAMFVDMIAACCRLRRKDRLMDLGCGPGFLAIPFARWAGEVVGVDPEPEMLETAARAAKAADLRNLNWQRGGSRDLGPHLGRFRVVTIGRAFHWMDRAATLRVLHDMIVSGGAVVVVGEAHERTPTSWRAIVRRISDRRGDERQPHEDDPSHDQIIAASPFRGPQHLDWPVSRTWTIEEIMGNLRSTSMGALRARAGTTDAFEAEARQALLEAEPSGRFS
jgi:ubiquinone/menaquinone biosynthesis C-methylase UbiE